MPRPKPTEFHPDNCPCCTAPTPLSQALDELSFERSACAAAQKGDISKLQRLLQHNPSSAIQTDGLTGGYTPLHYACREGHVEVVQLLLQYGADPNATTSAGRATPLMRAAYMGHLEVCRQLIDNKPIAADVSLRDADGESALDKATKQGCQEVVKLLSKYL